MSDASGDADIAVDVRRLIPPAGTVSSMGGAVGDRLRAAAAKANYPLVFLSAHLATATAGRQDHMRSLHVSHPVSLAQEVAFPSRDAAMLPCCQGRWPSRATSVCRCGSIEKLDLKRQSV